MINKNIVIAALARNCDSSLKLNIPVIEEFRRHFKWSEVIVVENDSIDMTKELLSDWKLNHSGVNIISNDKGIKTIPDKTDSLINPMTSFQRIERMVEYRNLYVDFINNINHDIDVLIVIDIDVIKISLDGLIETVLSITNKTGGIFSNGITKLKYFGFTSKIYFDTFAVYEYPMLNSFSFTQQSLDKTFKSINKKIKENNYYNIISCFSGVGVYNYNAVKGIKYRTVLNPLNNKEAICEHIPFNTEIVQRGYSNYISSNFEVLYGTHNLGLIFKLFAPTFLFNIFYSVKKLFN